MRKSPFWKYLIPLLTIILAVGFMIHANVRQEVTPQKQESAPEKGLEPNPIERYQVSLGDPNAPSTIIMYYSLTCPHCHEFQKNELPKLQPFIDNGQIQFIFRDFPTDMVAIKATKIAWCHGKEKYISFAQKLLETQEQWIPKESDKMEEVDQKLQDIATQELQITEGDCRKCLVDQEVEESILKTCFDTQKAYNITAVPVFVINGKSHEGALSFEEIRKLLPLK